MYTTLNEMSHVLWEHRVYAEQGDGVGGGGSRPAYGKLSQNTFLYPGSINQTGDPIRKRARPTIPKSIIELKL